MIARLILSRRVWACPPVSPARDCTCAFAPPAGADRRGVGRFKITDCDLTAWSRAAPQVPNLRSQFVTSNLGGHASAPPHGTTAAVQIIFPGDQRVLPLERPRISGACGEQIRAQEPRPPNSASPKPSNPAPNRGTLGQPPALRTSAQQCPAETVGSQRAPQTHPPCSPTSNAQATSAAERSRPDYLTL
jgi:hypothetical protein